MYDSLGFELGEITGNEAQKGIEYGLLKEKYVGEKYVYDGGLVEHFRIELKEAKKNDKQKSSSCWVCEKPTKTKHKHRRVYCDYCYEQKVKTDAEDKATYDKLRRKMMFERAIKMLENQEKQINIANYKEAIKVVGEYIEENPTKFHSTEEVVATMELIKNRIHTKIEIPIAGYMFDFMLPELKVLLEIDGYRHETTQERDARKDLEAVREMGDGWEVVRIPTLYIAKNIKQLVPYVREAYEYQQRIRKQNNGIMPDYYSTREKEYYSKAVKNN